MITKNPTEFTSKDHLNSEETSSLILDKDFALNKELLQPIRDSFSKGKLYKGVAEVLNAISLHKNLKIYVCGALDVPYENALNQVLTKISNPSNELIFLNKVNRKLVYQAIANESPDGKVRKGPRRFFNTRLFALEIV